MCFPKLPAPSGCWLTSSIVCSGGRLHVLVFPLCYEQPPFEWISAARGTGEPAPGLSVRNTSYTIPLGCATDEYRKLTLQVGGLTSWSTGWWLREISCEEDNYQSKCVWAEVESQVECCPVAFGPSSENSISRKVLEISVQSTSKAGCYRQLALVCAYWLVGCNKIN